MDPSLIGFTASPTWVTCYSSIVRRADFDVWFSNYPRSLRWRLEVEGHATLSKPLRTYLLICPIA
ncbi:MAG: hypothetical protein QXO38_05615 [Candidatus Nezhaarchaeales archaeon]